MLETNREVTSLAPKPVTRPQKFAVPANAWDCHTHVVGAPLEHPYVETRQYTPPTQTPEALLAAFDAAGIRYGVAVQISVHGTDNSYMIDALRRHPDRLTGVAVIDLATPQKELAEMKDAGVVGIRLLEAGGGVGTADLERFDALCAELGWHIQLCVHGHRYTELLPRLLKLRSLLVIDHMGWFSADEGVSAPGFEAVLNLLRTTGAWLKMSGGFRLSKQGAPYDDTIPFMEAVADAAPDRLVWGSDWPHVSIFDEKKMPSYSDLLDLLWKAVPDDGAIAKILVDNPARLYARSRGAARS